ncbi:platelet glycoprotein Ib alpha chain-like [Penaeus vannamei]|uniref:platelet glycoprotein Ib alpha chain-like n=1 Tax=Penaeus vannamei TaxID=6689 RepID=UPI00387F94C9
MILLDSKSMNFKAVNKTTISSSKPKCHRVTQGLLTENLYIRSPSSPAWLSSLCATRPPSTSPLSPSTPQDLTTPLNLPTTPPNPPTTPPNPPTTPPNPHTTPPHTTSPNTLMSHPSTTTTTASPTATPAPTSATRSPATATRPRAATPWTSPTAASRPSSTWTTATVS